MAFVSLPSRISCIISLFMIVIITTETKDADVVYLARACNDLDDGLQYIKPSKYGSVIPVVCDNGYTMIDISLNFDNYESYFSSLQLWESNLYGTGCNDFSSWRQWWLPASYHEADNTLFQLAYDCDTCESTENWLDNSGIYMTKSYFCFGGKFKPHNFCENGTDLNSVRHETDTLSTCNICGYGYNECDHTEGADTTWCTCQGLEMSADTQTMKNHSSCVDASVSFSVRAAVSSDRSFCSCYQPSTSGEPFKVSKTDLPAVSSVYKDDIVTKFDVSELIHWDDEDVGEEDEVDCDSIQYYLSQDDFEFGTIRITSCGEYILTQDIEINFNAPSDVDIDGIMNDIYDNDWSPNDYNRDDLYWNPTSDQSIGGTTSDTNYFGLNDFYGSYQFGFFAGITIETDNVVLNLNGFEIKMNEIFYLQQRWFMLIELADRAFLSNQGPGDFGRNDMKSASNVIIKDGNLGLSSHHAIHGLDNINVEIYNVDMYNFDVAGVQCNGCQHVYIHDCNVGPQNTDIPVLGRYLHARSLLPRIKIFVDYFGEEEVSFGSKEGSQYQRSITIEDLSDQLVHQMDLIFFYVTYGSDNFDPIKYLLNHNIVFTRKDAINFWEETKKLFLNENGWMDGGSSYGMVFSGSGAAVIAIGRRTSATSQIIVDNVEINGVYSQPIEGVWSDPNARGIFFDTIDWVSIMDGDTGEYIGDTMTDLYFAMSKYMNDDTYIENPDFCFVNTLNLRYQHMDWVFGTSADNDISVDPADTEDDDDDSSSDEYYITQTQIYGCGSDIQSHSTKGAMGIRIDGVEDFELSNIKISNIENWGELGSNDENVCGNYEVGGTPGVDVDIQPGYVGTRSTGILIDYASGTLNNIEITNVLSKHGTAIGISVYKGSDISEMSSIKIDNINAGYAFNSPKDLDMKFELPNHTPYACSVQRGAVTSNTTEVGDFDSSRGVIDSSDVSTIVGTNIIGFDICGVNGNDELIGQISTYQDKSELLTNSYYNMESIISKHDDGGVYFGDTQSLIRHLGILIFFMVLIMVGIQVYVCYLKRQVPIGNKYMNSNDRGNVIENSPLLDD